jgi:hypothetical protein
LSNNGYFLSFFFWLDLAALMSIMFDVYFLLNTISVTFQLPSDATDVARAGRAGRAGTRVGRLLKIVRLIRVFRVAKLYKETKKAMDERRKVLKNIEGNSKVVPMSYSNIKKKIMDSKHFRKRGGVVIRNRSRKLSFLKKIQGVKDVIG